MKLFLSEDDFQAAGDKEAAAVWREGSWLDFPPKFVTGISNFDRDPPDVLANAIDLTPLAAPAPTEPPVWKGGARHIILHTLNGTPYCAFCSDKMHAVNQMRPCLKGARPYTAEELGHSPPSSATNTAKHPSEELTPSPLDRALEAFVARRKAKRAKAEALEKAGAHIPYAETTRINGLASDVARAMSAPLSFTARLGGR